MIGLVFAVFLLFVPTVGIADGMAPGNISEAPALYNFMEALVLAVEQGPDFQQFSYQETLLWMPKQARSMGDADATVVEKHLQSISEDVSTWCRHDVRLELSRLLPEAMHDLRALLGSRIFKHYVWEVATRYDVSFTTYYVADDYSLVLTEMSAR